MLKGFDNHRFFLFIVDDIRNTKEEIIKNFESKLFVDENVSSFIINPLYKKYLDTVIIKNQSEELFYKLYGVKNPQLFKRIFWQEYNLAKFALRNYAFENMKTTIYIMSENYDKVYNYLVSTFNISRACTKQIDIILKKIPKEGFNTKKLSKFLALQSRGANIFVQDAYGEDERYNYSRLNQAIECYDKFECIVDKINEHNFSPFEKFLIIHNMVCRKIYKNTNEMGENFDNSFMSVYAKSRSFINVMTGEYIVCTGYAEVMKRFCNKFGIECDIISGYQKLNEKSGIIDVNNNTFVSNSLGHSANIVKLKDDVYNIDGYYFCDACWDCRINDYDKGYKFHYSLVPMQDLDKIEQSKYFNIHSLQELYKDMPQKSAIIPFKAYKKAIDYICMELNYPQEVKNQIIQNIAYLVKNAKLVYKGGAENCFYAENEKRFKAKSDFEISK